MNDKSERSEAPLDLPGLTHRYLDGELLPGEREALTELLSCQDNARSEFVRCLLLQVRLEEILAQRRSEAALGAIAVNQCEASGAGAALRKSRLPEGGKRARPVLELIRQLLVPGGHLNVPVLSCLLLLCMIFSATLAGWIVNRSWRTSILAGNEGSVAQSTPLDDRAIVPAYTATLINVTNCRWDSNRSSADVLRGTVSPGQSLNLLEGVAQINSQLRSGATAEFQLEGPLALVLTSEGMPSLQFGRMTAAFRSDDDEFTLDTPLGRVVVSGHASVGIVAAADEVELHTFSGAARFEYWLTDVERAPNRVSVEPGMSTHARVASGGGLSIEHGKARENHFAAKRDSVDSHLVISDKYVRKILQAKPLGYWRFESDEGGVIRNEAADRLHCRIIGDAIRLRSAGGNRTAEFGATAGSGYLFSEDVVEGIGDSYTTEVWIKPSYYHHAIIFSLVEPHDSSFMQHQFLMELCGPGPGAPATRIWDEHPKQIRFLHRGINRDEPSQCYSQGPYVLGKWQHVAVVKDAEEVRSYVDGVFVASVKDTFPLGDRLHVLMGQLYPKDSSGREVWLARLFVGQLDEVAFYDRALTAEEINQHYHAVRPEPTGAPDTVSSARDTS